MTAARHLQAIQGELIHETGEGHVPYQWTVAFVAQRITVFWARVVRGGPDECWLWTGGFAPNGYGRFSFLGRPKLAHRLAYEWSVGSIPSDLTIDHLCGVRACCNPAHLEPVTRGENTLRGDTITGANLRKTHCKHGHLFDGANTRWCADGSRECRTCRCATTRRWRAKQVAA